MEIGEIFKMDSLFKYIDSIPELPQELIDEIINHDLENLSQHKINHYRLFKASEKLNSWCRENIDGVERVAIQEILADVGPHTDLNRECAINYLVTTGNGKLCHYSSDHVRVESLHRPVYSTETMNFSKPIVSHRAPLKLSKEISRVDIQTNRWHIINTKVLHGVVDINSVRLALTINICKDTKYI